MVPPGSRYDGHRTAAGYPITYRRRRFGETDEVVIKAVKIAEADGKPSTPGSNVLPLSAKIKPTPSVPPAPSNLPAGYDFCVQENGMFIRARDPNHKLHGKHVLGSCYDDDETGMRMCSFDVGGDVSATVPACVDPANFQPAPVPQGCCVDLETSTLVCEGDEYHGLIVEIVNEDEIDGMKIASVEHPDLPGGGARMPICVPMDKPKRPPVERPPADRVPSDCCIDEESLAIVCADPTHSQHGRSVKDIFKGCVDKIDGRYCRLKVGDRMVELPVCHVPPPPPPDIDEVPEAPVLCCYDVESGTLVCPKTMYHGLKVDAVTMTELPDGTQIASVEHPSLPGGGLRAPMCAPIRRPAPEPRPRPYEPEPTPEPEPCLARPDPYCTEHEHCGVVEADAQGYGVGYRGISPLPGMRGAGQEGHRFGSGYANVQDRGYGVGHRGSSPIPGMRGAGQGVRFGTDHAVELADSRGYGVGYRGQSPLPGMRGAGQGMDGHRFSGFSGRPGELPDDHGDWKNYGPLASARDGWKPPMTSLQQGGICSVPWGNLGIENPANISGDTAGYNTRLWQNQPHDHIMALEELGYEGSEEEMLFGFQSDWNRISQAIANNEGMKELDWTRLIYGNLTADGRIGPNTLNGLEIALVNQKNGLVWAHLVQMAHHPVKQEYGGRRFARTTKARIRRKKKMRPRAPGCWVSGKYVVPCPDSAGSVSAAPGNVRKPGCWVNGKYVVPCPDSKSSSKR